MNTSVKLIECPRDAMQGWPTFIPTASKIEYINTLLQVGFDTIDVGSFVSPKAIPQMADTPEVLAGLDLSKSASKLLAIVANERGAIDAVASEKISYLGFPFSVSETFQQRNTNTSREDSLNRVATIQELCVKNNKQLVVYLSMGFGNPYGDPYSPEIVLEWMNKLIEMDISILSLADTVGLATPHQVSELVKTVMQSVTNIEVGVHLHATHHNAIPILEAAYQAGCRRFDGAINGIGGCPMAGNALVGNMDTVVMTNYFEEIGALQPLNKTAFEKSRQLAQQIFI